MKKIESTSARTPFAIAAEIREVLHNARTIKATSCVDGVWETDQHRREVNACLRHVRKLESELATANRETINRYNRERNNA